jgi:hypothetical protein
MPLLEVPVLHSKGLRYVGCVSLVLFLCISVQADNLVDVYVHMTNATPGAALTPTLMTAGTAGMGGGHWENLAGAAGMSVGPDHIDRAGPVTVGGVTYPANYPTHSLAYDNAFNFSSVEYFFGTTTKKAVSTAGFITFGPANAGGSGNLLDLVRIDNVDGIWGVFQLWNGNAPNGYGVNIETNPGGQTTHSAFIQVTPGGTYWFCLKVDFGTGKAFLNLYSTPSFALVGSLTANLNTGKQIEGIRYGNEEVSKSAGHTTYFEQIVIDYTNAVFPLGPWVGIGTSRCDLNNDNAINVSDVQQSVNQAVNAVACSSGDINSDGFCNVIDVQRVVNAALGGQCVTQ